MLMKQLLRANATIISGYKGGAEILAAMERREVDGVVALLANVTTGNPSYFKRKQNSPRASIRPPAIGRIADGSDCCGVGRDGG
jgi:hypothetical protein